MGKQTITILTVIALSALGWYYLRLPAMVGLGQYTLYAELPRSGGLYATANVTYRGITIGKVTAVEPTETGARATTAPEESVMVPVTVAKPVWPKLRDDKINAANREVRRMKQLPFPRT